MSKEKDVEVPNLPTASLADLIGSGPDFKWIEVQGKKIKIKKLNLGDLQKVYGYAGDDPFKTTVAVLQRAIVEPALNPGDIEQIAPLVANEIIREVSVLSGWTEEQIRAATNL